MAGPTSALKYFLKNMAPDFVRRAVRSWREGRLYRGNYGSWSEASADADGYGAEDILKKVVEATRAVRDGRAVWERDTVLFHESVCHEPLLAGLRLVALAEGGRLSVLDFGGALGSTWWQHRCWLEDVKDLSWSIVEQAGFVAAGRREFTLGPLRFYPDIDVCFEAERPNVILLSSVLPYLQNPHALLADLSAKDCDWIIIDRTGFVMEGRDWLTVQHVPESIYKASYPCWFFDREGLLAPLKDEWKVVSEWPTFDEPGADYEYRGLLLQRMNRRSSSA